jgi:hypothetical protein
MERIDGAIEPHKDWRSRLEAGCEAYVAFAEENREYMLVMFRAATPSSGAEPLAERARRRWEC